MEDKIKQLNTDSEFFQTNLEKIKFKIDELVQYKNLYNNNLNK
jgi:hypothetical protein